MIRNFLRFASKKYGYELNKTKNKLEISTNILFQLKVDLVLDIGANIGQYALDLRLNGYKGKIISFEPLPAAHKKLLYNSKNDKNWIIYKRIALGNKDKITNIYRSNNEFSSSTKKILKLHLKSDPSSFVINTYKIDVINLDKIYSECASKSKNIFVKIDTQGSEAEILEGFRNNLQNVSGIKIELSTLKLYKNQMTYEFFFKKFKEKNFSLWSIEPSFISPVNGRHLQFDAIFINNKKN